MSTRATFTSRHRGPYQFQVLRPKPTRKYPYTCLTLPGVSNADEVDAEARALLADPRDTIIAVYVWSVREQQHVFTYTKKGGR